MFSWRYFHVGAVDVPMPETLLKKLLGQNKKDKSVEEELGSVYKSLKRGITKRTPNFKPFLLPKKNEEITKIFAQQMQEIFTEVNTPDDKRKTEGKSKIKLGVQYKHDSVYKYDWDVDVFSTNNIFWSVDNKCVFKIKKNRRPSVALTAWFEGPTLADCGSTLQACIWKFVWQMLGTKKFDQLFKKSLTIIRVLNEEENENTKNNSKAVNENNNTLINPIDFLFNEIKSSSKNHKL